MAGLGVSRRAVVAGLGSALTIRSGLLAAQASKTVVGFLVLPARVPPSEPYFAAFEQALAEGGFHPGSTVTVEYRYANNHADQLHDLARELLNAGATMITTPSGILAIRAAQDAAPNIPVVAILTDDPVRSGIISSLNRPGGKITGVIAPSIQMLEKELELAHDLVVAKGRVAVLIDAAVTGPFIPEITSAADRLGLTLVSVTVASEHDIDAAFGTFAREAAQCLVVPWTPLLLTRHEQIVALAASGKLPDIYAPSDALSRGGLISYGSSFPEMWHLLGTQTAKVLAGAKPSDIPVEFPARIELRINLKVARERGITIPSALLARADSVIE